MTGPPRSAYVHVPFCRHRCGYCDFTLVADRDDLIEGYLQAIEREIDRDLKTLPKLPPLQTLFLGGGTPSHLPTVALDRLLNLLRTRFELASDVEWSMECNPLDVTEEFVEQVSSHGVNRISLGVQAFDDDALALLERDHRERDIEQVVELVRSRIPNVSLDLIFGVPGQSVAGWERTLSRALELQPKHLSTYGLTFEQGTAFWKRRRRGELVQTPPEIEREQYALTIDRLTEAGFRHYELSNFARRGFESEHNQVYWHCEPCLAYGPGAASLVDRVRAVRYRHVPGWITRTLDETRSADECRAESERLTDEDLTRDRLIFGLRMLDGISLSEFKHRTGHDPRTIAGEEIDRLIERGLLHFEADRLRLTTEGIFLADEVAIALS